MDLVVRLDNVDLDNLLISMESANLVEHTRSQMGGDAMNLNVV